MSPPSTITISRYILDTRPLWPTTTTATATTPPPPPKAQMHDFTSLAARALALLPAPDRAAVLRYYHVRDAKMALASHLLKRLAIVRLLNIPWAEAHVERDGRGKPIYSPRDRDGDGTANDGSRIEFNVSHQAGVVVCVAAVYSGGDDGRQRVELGTDVVCVNERNDYARIDADADGFAAFLSMHSDVFCPLETRALQADVSYLSLQLCGDDEVVELKGYARDAIARCQKTTQSVSFREGEGALKVLDGKRVVEAKLRRFYALWCLREAYVKMTGEALLAEWLRELEFRAYQTPAAAVAGGEGAGGGMGTQSVGGERGGGLEAGEVVTDPDFEIYFKGKRVTNVVMELRALGQDYMIATAARVRNREGDLASVEFGRFVELDMETDVLATAEAR